MKLIIELNRRLLVVGGLSLVAVGVLWAAAHYFIGAYQDRKAAEMRASYAACEKRKVQYLLDHRFDTLIKEQEWITNHPEDPRLQGAPHGKQLEEELNGEFKGTYRSLKEDDVPSNELTAFTGRERDYSLSESDKNYNLNGSHSDPSIVRLMLLDGSLPDMPDDAALARAVFAPASGLDGYNLVPENDALMKALENSADEKNNVKQLAELLGYTYSFKQEDSRKNVIRAIRFANIFSPYSEILSSYARTGEDPATGLVISSPFFCAAN